MASNTIAKLAVIITGDASPLTKSLDRASVSAKRFVREDIDGLQSKMNQLKQVMGSLQSGNFLGIVGNVTKLAGPFGAIAAATAAISYNLAAASDAHAKMAGSADTWAAQVDRVQAATKSIAVSTGRPLAEAAKHETRQWADILSFIADRLMPDVVRQERELVSLRTKQTDELKRGIDLRTTEQRNADKEKAKFDALLKTRADLAGNATRLDNGKLRFTDQGQFESFQKNKAEIEAALLARELAKMEKARVEAEGERGREMGREQQETNRRLREGFEKLQQKKAVELKKSNL